ncbi:MAG TPA: hypothetical protein VEQ66_15540 [Propionibacteriaceae bacterium]|nr:hypothetical protein [Propionibacteriaceae bacterium]
MSTDSSPAVRRVALVLAGYTAEAGTPPGIAPHAFANSCLADSYEVLADLVGVSAGIAGGGPVAEELLWPGGISVSDDGSCRSVAHELVDHADELVLVPADVPDLPGLVVAKVFKALQRAAICVAPERGGSGCAALGVQLPWPDWLPDDLDLDDNPLVRLRALAPESTRVATGPEWHRMRTASAIHRLDPGLEGWELTRALLSGDTLEPG